MSRLAISTERKELIRKLAGCAVVVFAIFNVQAVISYTIHWRADMSADVLQNAAGSLGYGYGRFLVSRCFGFGSLMLLWFMIAAAIRLIRKESRIKLVPVALNSLYGAFVLSLAFAYIGSLCHIDMVFSGGLGGDCGRYVCAWLTGALGTVVTGLVIGLMLVVSAICCSPRFANWVRTWGDRPKKKKAAEELHEESVKALGEETSAESAEEEVEEKLEEEEKEEIPAVEIPAEIEEKPVGGPEQAVTPSEPEFTVTEDEKGLETKIHEPLPRIDIRLDPAYGGLPNFKFFPLNLLNTYENKRYVMSQDELDRNRTQIINTLKDYKIELAKIDAVPGPTVTLYKLTPAAGVRISQIKNLQDDIALKLKARGVRMVQLPDSVGIEVANDKASIVPLRALLNSDEYKNSKYELPIPIGYTITQKVKVFDLANAPHLLVAGATQQGKSVGLNVIITSLLYGKHPSELKFVFVDPKEVEFNSYAGLVKHYLAVLPDADDEESERNRAIVKKAEDAEKTLRSVCIEMDARYSLLASANVNKITLYNDRFLDHKLNPDKGHRYLPYLVVIVDEFADLTMTEGASPEVRTRSRAIMASIARLAQKGRAAGIHVILATQRPSIKVINGDIKSNFPMRIAFRTSSPIDSQTILGSPGAEKLIGKGDMLFSGGIDLERIQCGYVDNDEITAITDFISSQTKYGQCFNIPYYLPELPKDDDGGGSDMAFDSFDDKFEEAARLVVSTGAASTSSLQTRMGMGFAKSARIMNQLEAAGIVSPQDGAKKRQVLVGSLDELDELLNNLR